jgi:hypothetical protein
MIGSLWGTDSYFRSGASGLTDYGIGGATDGQWDGVIFRWNDPLGLENGTKGDPDYVSPNRWGWASGSVDGMEGDGPPFVTKYGANAVNGFLVSIERSDGGLIGTPMSAKQFESICQLTAYWFDQMQVPHDQFPKNPANGLVSHFLHKEFATKDCPFPVVYNEINRIQDRIRAILKAAQEVTVEPPPVPVPPPDPGTSPLLPLPKGMSWNLIERLYGNYVAPWGEIFEFNDAEAASQVWFNTAVRSIPDGKEWDDGVWPPLEEVIRRGKESDEHRDYVYQWRNGAVYVSHR